MQSFRWDDAQILLALLETKTLSGAGLRLGINTSTVGRRLESLETVLGSRLFDRTPDGVLATALAEELRPYAEELSRAAAQFAMAAVGRDLEVEGEVKLTAPPGVAESLLAPALPRLFMRWPRLRITLDASVSYVDLTRREADIAIRVKRPTQGDLVSTKLGEGEEIPVTSAEYAASLGAVGSLGEARWITWGESLAHLSAAVWVLERVPASSLVLRTNSISAQLSAAAEGLGVVLLEKSYACLRHLVPLQWASGLRLAPFPRGALWLVGHRALRGVPKIAAVWDFIKEEALRVGLDGSLSGALVAAPKP
jgi:DNA-binding transcriptional LysR family regulator